MKYDVSFLKQEEQQPAKLILRESKFIEKELSIKSFDNATILPLKDTSSWLGGVVTSSNLFVESSGLYEERTVGIYDYDRNAIFQDNHIVLYMGFLLSGYGHLITDDLKKLWALTNENIYYDKIVYIADWQERNPPKHVLELFELLDIDILSWECVTNITKYKQILVPDNSYIHHNNTKYFTIEFKETIQQIKKGVATKQIKEICYNNKVYFSRTGFSQGWKREVGERQIELVFRVKGFSIIHPENLSVAEQIAIVMNCNEFASTEGSIGHNSIWCEPGTKVTLIRKVDVLNIWQMAINEVADLNVTYIDAHNSIRTNKQFPMIGPFYMCITPELEKWAGERIHHIPLWMRPSWINYRYQIAESRFYKNLERGKNKIQKLLS